MSSQILHRQTKTDYPVASYGEGAYIFDKAGKKYLDASGGAAVSCLGHSNPKVIQAIKDQLDQIPFAHSAFFTNEPSERLAEFLVDKARTSIPDNRLSHVYFLSGGSEANETALKLARQYFVEKGETQRQHFIARRQSYHGNTLGVLSIGGNAGRRKIYEPILRPSTHIAPCFEYRNRGEAESSEAYALRAADELEQTILRIGPDKVLAFMAETVVGATAGAVPPAPGYFKRIREICDRYGVLLILDEIMCGMGRTGTLYACEQDGISPDILTCAKGLGGGYQPIGACLMSQDIYQTISEGSGAFQHGFTYIGHATACAAALAVQQVIQEENLLARVQELGEDLKSRLDVLFGQHPFVGDIRGRGLFLGLELVQDRTTKEPFDPALKLFAQIKAQAMEAGLICYPAGGTADGTRGDHILLAPPFIYTESHLDELTDKLQRTLDQVFSRIST